MAHRSDRSGLRRYPALAYLVAAGALALLLPSGLIVPQSGPPTLAEYAPVPGEGPGQGNVSEFGQASSAGGASKDSVAPSRDQTFVGSAGRIVRKPGTKHCVAKPPRQTDDPLSPPCIAFFEGDNGGRISKGVTKDTVNIAIDMDEGTRDPRDGTIVDCGEAPSAEDTAGDLVCKSYWRFFNERYQTYGRDVRIWHAHGLKSGGPASLENTDDMEVAASYVCRKLAGRPAVHAGSPLLRERGRRFGVWRGTGGSTDRSRVFVDALKEQCDVIPVSFVDGDDRNGTAKMQSDNVTTVVMMDGVGVSAAATTTATQQGWFPEWIVLGNSSIDGLDSNLNGRLQNQAQWTNAFGITVDYRRDAMAEQHWFRAYREGCPSCATPTTTAGARDAPYLYDMFNMLFWGVQAAGPKLSPANLDRGLHAILPQGSSNPYKPAAYFAPGNYSFVKDAAAIWWDPAQRPPGSPETGCYRLPGDGRRLRSGEWETGDTSVRSDGPCQGDPIGRS